VRRGLWESREVVGASRGGSSMAVAAMAHDEAALAHEREGKLPFIGE
jgi:hypothetical protein